MNNFLVKITGLTRIVGYNAYKFFIWQIFKKKV